MAMETILGIVCLKSGSGLGLGHQFKISELAHI